MWYLISVCKNRIIYHHISIYLYIYIDSQDQRQLDFFNCPCMSMLSPCLQTSKKFMGRCFDPECGVITVPCTASEGIRHSGWFFICLSLECCPTNMPKWCLPNTCHSGVVSWNNEPTLILTLKPWSLTKAAKCFDSRCIKYDSGGSCNWSWPHDQTCTQWWKFAAVLWEVTGLETPKADDIEQWQDVHDHCHPESATNQRLIL